MPGVVISSRELPISSLDRSGLTDPRMFRCLGAAAANSAMLSLPITYSGVRYRRETCHAALMSRATRCRMWPQDTSGDVPPPMHKVRPARSAAGTGARPLPHTTGATSSTCRALQADRCWPAPGKSCTR
jgi:hypothetical protein